MMDPIVNTDRHGEDMAVELISVLPEGWTLLRSQIELDAEEASLKEAHYDLEYFAVDHDEDTVVQFRDGFLSLHNFISNVTDTMNLAANPMIDQWNDLVRCFLIKRLEVEETRERVEMIRKHTNKRHRNNAQKNKPSKTSSHKKFEYYR